MEAVKGYQNADKYFSYEKETKCDNAGIQSKARKLERNMTQLMSCVTRLNHVCF